MNPSRPRAAWVQVAALLLACLQLGSANVNNCTNEAEGFCKKGVCFNHECMCPQGTQQDGIQGPCIDNPSNFAVYKSLSFAGVLLLIGKALRVTVPVFQWVFLPASIISGLGTFIVMQILFYTLPDWHKYITYEYTHGWQNIGPFAIDVLFSSLFLGAQIPTPAMVMNKAGPQFVYNQVVNWGQFATAALTVACFCTPVLGSSPLLSVLIPSGFTGGHSFIFALQEEMEATASEGGVDYPVGVGLGLYIATLGQIFSFILGVAWINRAAAKGMLTARPKQTSQSDLTEQKLFAQGLFAPEAMPSAGKLTCSPDSMDVLSLHTGVILLCLLVGITLWELTQKYIQRFLFCMAFGILLQIVYEQLVKRDILPPLIDASIMARLQGLILDFLIVTAVSTLDVREILPKLPGATIATATTLVWMWFCTWYLAPHMLPDYWFERAICEFGQCTGVISSGLILLKMCDPKQTLPVMESFALKNFGAMPLMFTWLPLTLGIVFRYGIWLYSAISVAGLLFFIAIWFFVYRPRFARMKIEQAEGAPAQEMVNVNPEADQERWTDAKRRSTRFSRASTNFA